MKKYVLWITLLAWSLLLTGCGWPDAGWEANAFGPDQAVWSYDKYDAAKVAADLEEGKNVAVYFGATRCPRCMWMNKDIMANAENIPDDLKIYAADIDKDEEAVKEYMVMWKCTTLYLNQDGTIKESHSNLDNELDDILERANNQDWLIEQKRAK